MSGETGRPGSTRQTIQTYDQVAPDYLELWRDRSPIAANIKHFVELIKAYGLENLPILDVGCGPGFDAAEIRKAGLNAVGADLSWGMLRTGLDTYGGSFVQADMRSLPFGPAFAGLWVSASLLHLPHTEAAATIAAFARLLVQGGILYLSLKMGIGQEWQPSSYGRELPRYFAYWQPDELDRVLEGAGFQIVERWTGGGSGETTWITRFARIRGTRYLNIHVDNRFTDPSRPD